jgi:hypothetical protein
MLARAMGAGDERSDDGAPIAGAIAGFAVPFVVAHALAFRALPFVVEGREGGRATYVVSALAAAAAFVSVQGRSRGPKRRFLAPVLAAAIVLVALAWVPLALAEVVEFVAAPRALDAPEGGLQAFLVGVIGAATPAAWAALLGAAVCASAALGAAARARHDAARLGDAAIAPLFAMAAAVGVVLLRVGSPLGASEGLVAPAFALVALVAIARVAPAAQGGGEDDAIEVALLGVASVALATLSAAARGPLASAAAAVTLGLDAGVVARAADEARAAASREGTLGFACALAVLLAGAPFLAPRAAAAGQGRVLALVAVVLGPVLVPCVLVPLRLAALAEEAAETRPGAPGEVVEDRHVPAGELRVDLVPADECVSVAARGVVRAEGLGADRFGPDGPAVFDGVDPGARVRLAVDSPYLAAPRAPFAMPRDRGARLRLPVLTLAGYAPTSAVDELLQPDKVLHVSLLNPGRVELDWALGRTIASRVAVSSARDLDAELLASWQQQGNHRDPYDRKVDMAIVHAPIGARFEDLVGVVAAIGRVRRPMRGPGGQVQQVPAFLSYVAVARLTAAAGADEGELADLSESTRAAFVRCAGTACERPANRDPFGIEALSGCGERPCAGSEEASTRLRAAEEVARLGDLDRAARFARDALRFDPSATLLFDAPSALRAIVERARRDAARARVRVGTTSVSGRLAADVVARGIESRVGLVRACYADALARAPGLVGNVGVRFVVDRTGRVASTSNGGSSVTDAAFVRCAAESLLGARFPAPEGGVVTVTVNFALGGT